MFLNFKIQKMSIINSQSFKYYSQLNNTDVEEIKINSKNKNMYYSMHQLNIFLLRKVKSNLNLSYYYEKNNRLDYELISNSILNAYLENFKESIYPLLFHEYNILVDEEIVKDGLSDFINNITNDFEWLVYFFEKYPVLSDIFNKLIQFSEVFLKEILNRMISDEERIEEVFALKLSELQSIKLFVGDKHNNNKAVVKLIFKDSSIYYKPRSLECENSIDNFLDYLIQNGFKQSMRIPKIILGEDYGWMECIEFKELKCFDHASDFYYNQGVNLSIFYTLSATDLINDNLIVNDNFPFFFDLECIFQPDINDNPNFRIYERVSEASKFIANSVLKTNLLPQYSFVTNIFQGFSNSGLSLIESKIPSMVIEEVEGKFSRTQQEVVFETSNTHIPSFKKSKILSADYVDKLIEGFIYGYNYILENKNSIGNFIEINMKDLKIRVLHRPTFVYSKILEESYLPEYMSDYKMRDQLFDELLKAKNDYIDNLPIINSEIKQLKNLDIPLFITKSNSVDIFSPNGDIVKRNFFLKSGLEEVFIKLDKLGQEDKERQVELIKLSFCIHDGYKIKENTYHGSKIEFNQFKYSKIDNSLLGEEILHNYNKILKNGFKTDQQYSNYGLIQTPSYTWGISAQKWGLFDGMDGLSFFYLNLFRVYGNLEALKIGKGFIELGLAQFEKYDDFYSKTISFNKISLFNFPISTFYIAEYYLDSGIELLGLTNVLQDKLVDWIERYYSEDFDFDLLSGGSGTILYLLKLYDRIKEDRLLFLCKKIALNIIRNAKITNDDSLSWISKFGKTHTGFSHGTSGIAFSLFKLNAYLPDEKIKLAAIKALNFERKMFDVEKNYWYPFRLYKNDNFETIKTENHFWAYGSGGIALSRILILDLYQDDKIKHEIKISVNNIKEKGWSGNFNYSSGVFGNIDVLNEYAYKLQDNDVKSKLKDFLNTIINEKRNGFESWSCAPVGKEYNSNFEMIGFFTGISGMSNTMLNILDYEKTVKLFQ